MGKIKISTTHSDKDPNAAYATGYDTKVVDIETGKEIEGIQSIKIDITPDNLVLATIKVFPAFLELEIDDKHISIYDAIEGEKT